MKTPVNYRFYPDSSERSIKIIKLIDRITYFFKSENDHRFKGDEKEEITLVQLAHIGDMILMLPAIKALKIMTGAKISLVVSSGNFKIATKVPFIDAVYVADAPYFSRDKKISYLKFLDQLRRIKTGILFDVRGDLRNNLFLKLFAKKKIFAGYNVGGGGALLDAELPYVHRGHVSKRINPLFNYLNLPDPVFSEYWEPNDLPCVPIEDVTLPEKFVLVHLGTGAQARKWPVQNFIQVIKGIALYFPVYVMGTEADLSPDEMTEISLLNNVTNCVGKFSMLQSISIVKRCTLFLGLDSGFSHIAALLYRKIVLIFSGTVNVDEWKPISLYKDQVTIIKETVDCDFTTGCGKLKCSHNICMTRISPHRVGEAVLRNAHEAPAINKREIN
ncbi:heptosyltransferase-2 [Mucilaginibacter sp. SG538B]|uniref:glycosyltransferase family 9 protein n=1 Tax=Mucilaginibacter sp. SG538B TaxID=2587021 RepID=UPI00159E80FB|nr:glycosyltransferase family 9 protein [Mucilaginibacter sp. SG538B]NVM66534.1 heptosyltransferase-2 [Mucilaginibacter sp. SG538B]